MRPSEALVVLVAAALAALGTLALVGASRRRRFGSDVDEATYRTLHTASRASVSLREGLTPAGVGRSAKHLRTLLGAPSIAVTDPSGVLVWDGPGDHHRRDVASHAQAALLGSRTVVLGPAEVACGDPDCELRFAVIAPVVARDRVVAALSAYGPSSSPGLVRATEELAVWLATQAELRALRAQISPHFVYNCLAAIASFVRTDPDRARELLLEFADFTRYSFRRGGAYTTLADELRNIERYLALEQARFGDRLTVTLTIAPEVLQVSVPFLAVQPLVENAVRHGLQSGTGRGHVTITAADVGQSAEIVIEDNGVGSDPEVIRAVLSGENATDSVGLGNVDARLRQAFGDQHGLVVETAPGAGTKVSFRVPKFAPGIRAGT